MSKTRPSYVRETAELLLSRGQSLFILSLVVVVGGSLVWRPHATLVGLISASIILYIAIVSHRIVIHGAAHYYQDPELVFSRQHDDDLPIYTVLVPMRDEVAIIPSHVRAMLALDYPRDKLDIIHVLEADDAVTQNALDRERLPSCFRRCLVPPVGPETKPKALNYGLKMARGEFCVIYDAEDEPAPDQLRKAVAAFKQLPEVVACLQARLAYAEGKRWYNRFYSVDYATHFWEMLRGMAKLNLTFPLGGTSNHFRVHKLYKVAMSGNMHSKADQVIGGWDAFNVTEDADMAIVLSRYGLQTLPLDSVTVEESPNHLFGRGSASRQRRRWLKGYLQTGLVHSRRPYQAIRQMGILDYLSFLLVMFGTPIALMLNPVFWSMTVIYAFTRSSVIQQLFPIPLYYAGMAVMLVGNLGLFYQLLMSCYRTSDWESVPKMFLVPVWWAFNSLVSFLMCYELILPSTRYRWNKTDHGHSTLKEAMIGK